MMIPFLRENRDPGRRDWARAWTQVPAWSWLRKYTSRDFSSDLFAGLITAILLVPQGIAFALLAGLPPQAGLYASILPPTVYAVLGTSRTLSVGPVSVAAIMVASALSAPELQGHGDYVGNALVLALESGLILLAMALFKMGALVNFVSHPVLTGFTSGAAVLIILSQMRGLLGIARWPCTLSWQDTACLLTSARAVNPASLSLGLLSLGLLVLFGKPLNNLLNYLKFSKTAATAVSKAGPLAAVGLSALAVVLFSLERTADVATVGVVPAGMPHLDLAFLRLDTWRLLLPAALFIALIAYVESVAVAKVLANLRRQRIDANLELAALGAANLAAAVSGGLPVAGGFSRTMVNFTAGARTPMAAVITAGFLALAVSWLTACFAPIPKAALAAIILVAIAPLVKFKNILETWRYDRGDGIAEAATFLGVLILGIEPGLALGIVVTLLSYLWYTSKPHIAVVGRVRGTEHFRNVLRHEVETWPELLLIRVDENLNFANTAHIEDFISAELPRHPEAKHLVLIGASISHVDATALESLQKQSESLRAHGLTLHLAEIKGPVMDGIKRTDFLERLKPGQVFFRTEDAVEELTGVSVPGEPCR